MCSLSSCRVAGSSVNLKNRFAGYNIELVVKQNAVNEIMEMVAQHLPGVVTAFCAKFNHIFVLFRRSIKV